MKMCKSKYKRKFKNSNLMGISTFGIKRTTKLRNKNEHWNSKLKGKFKLGSERNIIIRT